MKIKSLFEEDSIKFVTAWWGNNIALGFKGNTNNVDESLRAINRCYNWATNTGVTPGRLQWLYDKASIGYILTTHDKMVRGLFVQFRAEVIMNRLVNPIKDYIDPETESAVIEYDESAIDILANAMTERFMNEKITPENFLTANVSSTAPIYSMASITKSESSE